MIIGVTDDVRRRMGLVRPSGGNSEQLLNVVGYVERQSSSSYCGES